MTNEQLLELFQSQRDVFLEAQTSEQGKVRGLTLVTVDDLKTTTLAPKVLTLDPISPKMTNNVGDISDIKLPLVEGGTVSISDLGELGATGDPLIIADTPPLVQPVVNPMPHTSPLVEATAMPPQPAVFGELAPELQVNLNINFGFDSATLKPDQLPLLAQMCNVMKSSDINLFRIVGHTDAAGRDDYNRTLSQLRAEEVQRYLVNDCGIEARRLEAVGLGEKFLSDRRNPKGAANRRVEFQALS